MAEKQLSKKRLRLMNILGWGLSVFGMSWIVEFWWSMPATAGVVLFAVGSYMYGYSLLKS